VNQLKRYGYHVEHRILCAADYGAPTIRKRLFLVARRDGKPIRWPKQTHARRDKAEALGLLPWRTAAECIEWNRPCPSIFERIRPLAEATQRRIANGIRRFVIDAAEPFIVTCNHGGWDAGRVRSPEEPMPTLTASRDAHGVVAPHLVSVQNASSRGIHDADAPMPTITAYPKGGGHALVSPTLIQTGYGERDGQAPRAPGLDKPLGTIVATGKHALIAANLCGVGGRAGQSPPRSMDQPVQTITAKADGAICAAWLAKHYGGVTGHQPDQPIGTITQVDHHSIAAAHLSILRGTCRDGKQVVEPMPTLTAGGNHIAEVRAFLVSYYGNSRHGSSMNDPSPTIPTKHRLGLVTVDGLDYQIVDIGLRMLQPRELLRAQFGRFATHYILIGTQAQQVAGIGNSVCPELAEQIVKANVRLQRVESEAAA
jgi:DNA (cytosine-5)-methyltransferase 1